MLYGPTWFRLLKHSKRSLQHAQVWEREQKDMRLEERQGARVWYSTGQDLLDVVMKIHHR